MYILHIYIYIYIHVEPSRNHKYVNEDRIAVTLEKVKEFNDSKVVWCQYGVSEKLAYSEEFFLVIPHIYI